MHRMTLASGRYVLFTFLLSFTSVAPGYGGGFAPGSQPPPECKTSGALKTEVCLRALSDGLTAQLQHALSDVISLFKTNAARSDVKNIEKDFREAQSAWEAYRDASCQHFKLVEDGIAGTIRYLQCRRWTAWQRIQALKAMSGAPQRPRSISKAEFIEPDILTMADMSHMERASNLGDFSWYIKKRYGARLIERVLLERGFESKTARILAKNWDALRFHPETGHRLYKGPAFEITDRNLLKLGHRIPRCLASLARSTCQLRYASELGCRLDPPMARGCNVWLSDYAQSARAFPANADQEEIFVQATELYGPLACVREGGKGAGIPLFAPDTKKAVSRLAFSPVATANQPSAISETQLPTEPRDAPFCAKQFSLKIYDINQIRPGGPVRGYRGTNLELYAPAEKPRDSQLEIARNGLQADHFDDDWKAYFLRLYTAMGGN